MPLTSGLRGFLPGWLASASGSQRQPCSPGPAASCLAQALPPEEGDLRTGESRLCPVWSAVGNRCPYTEQCAPRAWLHMGCETKAEEAAFCKLKEWGRDCWAHFPKAFRHCQLQDAFQTVPETCFLLVGS